MCGIVGLYLKNPKLQPKLGEMFEPMLCKMTSRGPDSAGFAIYRDPVKKGLVKLTLAKVFSASLSSAAFTGRSTNCGAPLKKPAAQIIVFGPLADGLPRSASALSHCFVHFRKSHKIMGG